MMTFGVCFVLYLLKMAAGKGLCISNADTYCGFAVVKSFSPKDYKIYNIILRFGVVLV